MISNGDDYTAGIKSNLKDLSIGEDQSFDLILNLKKLVAMNLQ
jgi:hypothetical protein